MDPAGPYGATAAAARSAGYNAYGNPGFVAGKKWCGWV